MKALCTAESRNSEKITSLNKSAGGYSAISKALNREEQESSKVRRLLQRYGELLQLNVDNTDIVLGSEVARISGDVAFVRTREIHFAQSSFDDQCEKDRGILAHEVIHVAQKENVQGQVMTSEELELEANTLGEKLAAGRSMVGEVKGCSSRDLKQRFNGDEHIAMSDSGEKQDNLDFTSEEESCRHVTLAPDFKVTRGQVNALVDYFTLSDMRRFARHPEHRGLGTREEIEYALQEKLGVFRRLGTWSAGIPEAVEERYLRLAGQNDAHFTSPRGDVLAGQLCSGRVPEDGNQKAYRTYHAQALGEAIEAGQHFYLAQMSFCSDYQGPLIQDAMASEGASHHFLTDAFASGHIRVARRAVADYWNQKVPLFGINFEGWIAEKLAPHIKARQSEIGCEVIDFMMGNKFKLSSSGRKAVEFLSKYTTGNKPIIPLPNGFVNNTIGDMLASMLAGKPLTFGDLVAGALHDYDNHFGLAATTAVGMRTYYGDGQISNQFEVKGNLRDWAIKALVIEQQKLDISRSVAVSNQEVREAYQSAKSGVAPSEILEKMRGERFAAEHYWPTTDVFLNYQFKTVEELFHDEVFRHGIAEFIEEKAADIVEAVPGEYKTVFEKSCIAPLKQNPIESLSEIVRWVSKYDVSQQFERSAEVMGSEALIPLADRERMLAAMGRTTNVKPHQVPANGPAARI